MRALIVQHEHDGPAGALGDHLFARGYELVVHQVMAPGSTHSDEAFPDPTSFDAVVTLGSVHGVYERDVIGSWIDREIAMLRAAHEADVPTFGVCFGAQAITTALGGHVEKSPEYEIGWLHYETSIPEVIPSGPWFTWHGDRCFLPDAINPIVRNELCPQAFRVERTMGVQFHPEVTRDLVASWIDKCPPAYFEARGVSTLEMLAGFDEHGDTLAKQAATLFDWFIDEVAR
jgi:GMP synthase-like glutamine amidotransferase